MQRVRRLLPLLVLLTFFAVPSAHAAGSVISGPDVASYQHPNKASIDWNAVRRDGRRFTFIKATESTTYTSPYFAGDWRGSAAAGLFHGAYHFARPASPAKAQADYFAAAIGDQLVSGTLPPVLDLEDNGGLTVSALQAWTRTFLTELQAKTGRVPMIYTGPYFWSTSMGGSTAFTGYPLWIANYQTSAPKDIGWPRWTFWQYTDKGTSSGMSGAVDMNNFNGTSLDLAALARTGTWGPATSTVSESSSTGATTCGGYTALAPQRLLDTRSTTGPTSSSVTLTLPDSVPVDAVGVQLDVTAVQATGAGYLRVAPAGAVPATTALTYGTGRSTTGLVTTTADASRQVTVTVYGTAVDLVVDLVGYFGTGGAQWQPATPTRVADTRNGQGLAKHPLSGTADLDLSSAGVPSTATGVYLDVSAVNPAGSGYLRLGAAGTTPTTTVLNYDRGGSTTGLAVTATGSQHVTVSANGAPTDLAVDLLGWFDTAVTAGGAYCPVPPQRLLDTRTGLGATGPGTGPLALVTPSSIPSNAVAVVLDASAVDPSRAGFVRLTTVGMEATTTALNLVAHRSVTGLVVVPLSQAELVINAYSANTDLVLDVVGYLGPPPG